MWKLTIDSTVEKEYLTKFQDGLVDRIINGVGKTKLSKDIKRVLIPDFTMKKPAKLEIVEKMLTARPQEALAMNNTIIKEIFPDYDATNLDTLKRHKTVLKKIECIVNYNGIISKKKENSYWLARRIGHNTCTYCNRQYTITIGSDDKAPNISRPQFDHWFPKEWFPLLSLNLYNLIPSCCVCNSTAKGREVFGFDTHIHPYLQTEDEPGFNFRPVISPETEMNWSVILERKKNSKEDNTIKSFKLDEIYYAHGNIEVKDLMNFASGYTDNYLHDLFNNVLSDFSTKGYTKEDVFRVLFGVEYFPEHTLDRPLSKLKRDILRYLNVIL